MSLAGERSAASFKTDDLIQEVHGNSHKKKMDFEKQFSSNPLFDKTDDMYLSREEYMKKCVERSFETYRLVKKNKEMLSSHSPIHGEGGFFVGQMGTPTGLTDHFALFIGTILMQSSKEQQREWLMKAVNLQIIGTYAQTELGHGSNVRGLETTATYDADTDEFIINSGPKSAAKWWPGALGLLATHSITYARLIVGGKDLGFHAFMVQIRDENHKPMKGVEVGDIGPKMGYNAYDSGYLHLTDIRIPRFNMLAKFQQIEKGGKYTKAPEGLAKIAYLTMLKVRVAIACGAGMAMGRCLTVTVRYNLQRKQGFVNGKKTELGEKVILDHTIQQVKIFPELAAAYAIIFSSMQLRKMLEAFEAALKAGTKADTSLLPVLHATAAGMKAFTTDMACAGIEEVRRCNGGHAFSLSAGIGMQQMTYLPSVTFEGDFAPMALQTARFLVGSVKAVMTGKPLAGPAAYLKGKPRANLSTVSDLRDPAKLVAAFEDASRRAVFSVAMSLNSRMKTKTKEGGKVKFEDAWNAEHVGLMRASKNHTYTFILSSFFQHAKSLKEPKLQAALLNLVALFGISRLNMLGRHAKISPTCAHNMDIATMQLLALIRPDALALVDAFGFTDFQLTSAIGSYENADMYEKLVESARKTPLNKPEYVESFHQETISKFLNKEYLVESKKKQSHL